MVKITRILGLLLLIVGLVLFLTLPLKLIKTGGVQTLDDLSSGDNIINSPAKAGSFGFSPIPTWAFDVKIVIDTDQDFTVTTDLHLQFINEDGDDWDSPYALGDISQQELSKSNPEVTLSHTETGDAATSHYYILKLTSDTSLSGSELVTITWTMSWLLPGVIGALLLVLGLIFMGLSFVFKGKKKVAAAAVEAPFWEPTLGPRAPSSQPAAPAKPSKSKSKAPTRAAAPAAAASKSACKFCGKAIDPGAFFCPHCYSSLR